MLVASEIPLSTIWHLSFAEKKTKTSETHINHDQIRHIRNNWLNPIFFPPGDNRAKGLLVLLYLDLEFITGVDTGLCPLSVLPLMTNFSVFIPFQGIAPGNSGH